MRKARKCFDQLTVSMGDLIMKKYSAALVSILLLAGCNDNSGTGSSNDAEAAPVLQMLESQGVKVHGNLEAPGGLTAFAASAGTKPLAVYIMPDSNYALIGTLVDAQGNSVMDEALQKMVSEPLDQTAWSNLEAVRWVQDGDPKAERIVYTFTDANCPFCNELWRSARPWVEAGKVQLRHVMVGVISADSPAKAAAILEADNPEEALTLNEMKHSEGGIDPLDSISSETQADLARNAELMRELGFSGTPGVVAKRDDGSLIFQSGVARGAALDALFGPR